MLREDILKIINAGNVAPSGSNSQPWKFIIKNNSISIIATPEKEHPVFNFNNRGTYISHGALIENITIASSVLGYKPDITIFPDNTNPSFTAKIVLYEDAPKDHELYESIFKRSSNRKKYFDQNLDETTKKYIFNGISNYKNCRTITIEDKSQIIQAAQNLANDVILNLENKTLHELFFKEIIWDEDEQKKRGGLYIKTLEVRGPAIFIMKLLKNWKINNFLKKIHSQIYRENVKTLSSCALMGAILTNNNDQNFIEVGRLMQNIWLRATKSNLNFHLITGIPFLWQQVNFGRKEIFSSKDINLINESYKNLKNIFNLNNDEIIALTFRIGYGDKPSAISYKREPFIEFQ